MTFQRSDGQTRAIFTITPHESGWAIEHDGEILDPCRTIEEARAAASRRARACQDVGRPCQINVKGERGFFAARIRPAAAGAQAPASASQKVVADEVNDRLLPPIRRRAAAS